MIYALEFLDENADITVIEYNTDKGTLKRFVSQRQTKGYVEPKRNQIYLSRKEFEEDLRDDAVRSMYQMVGIMTMACEGESDVNAYEFVDEAIEMGTLPQAIESFVTTRQGETKALA